MTDFTSDQITTFRIDYIRDLVDANANPPVLLSHYNRALQTQFVADSTINAFKARIENDYANDLAAAWWVKYNERICANESSAAATTAADALRLDILFRMIRAAVTESMITDPGYVGSIADKKFRDEHFAELKHRITRDRTFLRSRAGAVGAPRIVKF